MEATVRVSGYWNVRTDIRTCKGDQIVFEVTTGFSGYRNPITAVTVDAGIIDAGLRTVAVELWHRETQDVAWKGFNALGTFRVRL
jgi:hypothetical protein